MGNNKRDLKGKTYEEIYGKSKADFIKNKQRNGLRKAREEGKIKSTFGKLNPNYKDGNRMLQENPCHSCGRPMLREGRHKNRLCRNCYNDSRFKTNEDKTAHKLLWYRKNRHLLKKISFDYLGSKCQRCGNGELPLCCYHFHHRNPKEKDFVIGRIFSVKNKERLKLIKKELDKCDLLCSNCHLIVHWEKTYTY